MMRTTIDTPNPTIDIFVRDGNQSLKFVGHTKWARTAREAREHYAQNTNRDPQTVVAKKHKDA